MNAACVEKRQLKTPGSTIWVPGLASSARMIIASRPPSRKKKKVVTTYWIADHLVIGVELEVVPPGLRAVLGVVVGDRRRAGGPAEPVVEAAEADQEADRGGDRGHDHVRVAGLLGLEDLEAADRAQRDDEAEAEEAADQHAEAGAGQSRVSSALLARARTSCGSSSLSRLVRRRRPRPGRRRRRCSGSPRRSSVCVADPLVELLLVSTTAGRAHRRVAPAAELGADDRVDALARRA